MVYHVPYGISRCQIPCTCRWYYSRNVQGMVRPSAARYTSHEALVEHAGQSTQFHGAFMQRPRANYSPEIHPTRKPLDSKHKHRR